MSESDSNDTKGCPQTDTHTLLIQDLNTAISQRNIELVKKLIGEGININACTEGDPPLVIAIQMEPIHLLSMEQEGSCRYERLIDAEHMSDSFIDVHPVSDIVSFLLNLDDIDIEVCGVDGLTPLHTAVINSLAGTVRLLLDKGASVNSKDKVFQRTPLHYATRQEWPAIIPLLLSYGADVDFEDTRGRTPLYSAVTNSDIPPEIIKLFIDTGASVNVKDSNTGRSLLHEAVYDVNDLNNSLSIINLLLKAGAPFTTDGFDLNPIHESFKWNRFACLAEFVRHGADVHSLVTEFGVITICELIMKRVHCLYTMKTFTRWTELSVLFDVIVGDGYILRNDAWLAKQKVPKVDSEFNRFLKHLILKRDACVTLKQICCYNVRNHLKAILVGKSILPSIELLEIPCSLKERLSLVFHDI